MHTNYFAVMHMYGGPPDDQKFQLAGIPSEPRKIEYGEIVKTARALVASAAWHLAEALGLVQLQSKIAAAIVSEPD